MMPAPFAKVVLASHCGTPLTIQIDEFVPRSEIDDLYLVRPYYIVPDGTVGHDAFAVIRETIRALDTIAIARVVLTRREHIITLEARDKALWACCFAIPTRCATPRHTLMGFKTSSSQRICLTLQSTVEQNLLISIPQIRRPI